MAQIAGDRRRSHQSTRRTIESIHCISHCGHINTDVYLSTLFSCSQPNLWLYWLVYTHRCDMSSDQMKKKSNKMWNKFASIRKHKQEAYFYQFKQYHCPRLPNLFNMHVIRHGIAAKVVCNFQGFFFFFIFISLLVCASTHSTSFEFTDRNRLRKFHFNLRIAMKEVETESEWRENIMNKHDLAWYTHCRFNTHTWD